MLPSLGFNEIVILGILALIVVGPKDLPLLFRKLGRWTAKLRGMAQEFRTGFDELARQAELDELKREVEALRRATSVQEIGRELSKPLPTLEDYAGVKPVPLVTTRQAEPSSAVAEDKEGAPADVAAPESDRVLPSSPQASEPAPASELASATSDVRSAS
jgi:sec-independent protein translocase protein TatB